MEFSIKQITFDEVLPYWRFKLWPERQDPIRSMSSMLFGGGIDMNIYKQFEAHFVGLFADEKLVGVLSGHGTRAESFRIRGLYVDPEFRQQGGALMLMAAMRTHCHNLGFSSMWSYPKLSALPVYERFGFVVVPSSENDADHVYVLLTNLKPG